MSNAREISQLAPLVTVDANNKITFASTSEVEFGGLTFPTTDGTNGQVLTTDGAGNLTFTSAAGGGLADIVEDTTPQLGGNLDVNDKLIYNDTGTVKLQAGTADYVTIVNSAGADRIRFSDTGGMQALGWYHQFGDSSVTSGLVNIMGSVSGFAGSGSLRIHDNDSSAHVELTVPTSVSANVTFTLPGADGTNGQVLTTDGSGNLSFTTPSGGGTELAVLSTKTIDNPNAYGTTSSDQFGRSVAISGKYAIVGVPQEDDAGGTTSGKAYIYDTEAGLLLHTLDNPNAYDTSASDNFGSSVAISGNYAIVGAHAEDDAGGLGSGKAYIFNVTTGTLVHTLDNPNAYDTSASDSFGYSVAISGNYAIVGAYREDDAGGTQSGKAYIYDTTSASLLYTLDNPSAFSTSSGDQFGRYLAISGNYVIVGAPFEKDANVDVGFAAGKAYIYDISTFTTSTISSANYVLDNPNPFGTSDQDYFGGSVAISGNYAIVGATDDFGFGAEDEAGVSNAGKAYIYDISTFTTSTISSATYVLDNPNAVGTGDGDLFGRSVGISGNYAVVGSHEDSAADFDAGGKAYIYDISTFTTSTITSATVVLDNPNAFGTVDVDYYGRAVAISGDHVIVSAYLEDDSPDNDSGKVYIHKINSRPYDYSGPEIASFAPASGSGGIALTDLSVTQNTASGNGTLSYNNTSGVFTYTPPDLSSYLTSVAFGDLTSTPTTIAGYGITDAFDGAFSSLSGTPTTIAGYGITDAFDGAYSSLTGAPTTVSSFTNDAGYLTSETTTTLTADSVNQRLVFTNETGTPANIDLSWAVDDTNLARITSGSVDAGTGIATFTRDDASTFTVDFSALFDDTNLTRITSGSVSGSTLTLTRSDATTVDVDVSSLNFVSSSFSGTTLRLIRNDGTELLASLSGLDSRYNTVIGTDTDINTSGSTIIDNIFVTDGVITSMGTRTLTPADIGALATSVANQNLNTNSSPTFTGLTIADTIIHSGDTNTYLQFHNQDEWRVVVAGNERLEVTNSIVTVQNDLTVNGGDITLGGTGRIQGIDTVSADTDAANKLYVDTAVAGAGGGGTELTVMSTKTLDNPNAYGTGASDNFGFSVAISGNYAIVSAYAEDTASASASGTVYIFDTETGSLLHTLDNPNAYSTGQNDYFGLSLAISGNYAIVGVPNEDDSGGTSSGKAYIYNVTTGNLLHTLNNPNAFSTSGSDNFGYSVGISGNYAIVGAYGEDDGGSSSGKAYIYDISTLTTTEFGGATYVLNNPNAYSTGSSDQFGYSVAISGNYAIVGAYAEDDAGGTNGGKAYIYDISTFTTETISSANYVLDNPNAYGTSAGDYFGEFVAISSNYAIVGARYEDDVGGTSSGKAYIYDISTFTTSTISSATYVLNNPNAYSTSGSDSFGEFVAISGNYAIVGARSEDDAGGSQSGKAYIYDISTFTTSTISSANYVLDNPNAYVPSGSNDLFGFSVAISGNYAIAGAHGEDTASDSASGKAYIFRTNGHPYSYSASEIASFAPAPASGGGFAQSYTNNEVFN